jgi:two-component system, sensor histidine kinase and response regulator
LPEYPPPHLPHLPQLAKPAFDPRDLVPEPLFCCDAEGRFVWVNGAASALTGYAISELIGQSFAALIAPAQRRRMAAYLRDALDRDATACREVPVVTRDGRTAWVGLRVRRIGVHNGHGYVACAHDLSKTHFELESLRRRVRELVAQVAEAQAAAQMKGEFLATMSHEIRTPMSAVIGMTHLLLESELDDDQRTFTEVIHSSAESLMELINDILDFSRIEAGKLELAAIDFDLRATVEGVSALLAPRANDKGLRFSCMVSHEAPSGLRGDPGRLRQVLLNLTSNAIKFTDQGEVGLRVELVEETPGGAVLRFAMSDSGVGIARDRVASLFQSFSQADPEIAGRFGGTGLGLAISRRLVKLMGGDVGVESVPGRGSTFWFVVPFEKQALGIPKTPLPKVELEGMRVLVAEATRTMRGSLVEMLQGWGCEVAEAVDGPGALQALRGAAATGQPFRVALVDMQLPGHDAEALATAIQADAAIADTLLMMLTNLGRRGDAARAEQFGYSAYLLKPVQQSHLYDALVEVVHAGSPPAKGAGDTKLVTRHSVAEKRRSRLRVLVVEDNPINQLVALAALRRAGYRPEAVGDGHKALEAIRAEPPDLIFMDVQMPDMDGLQTTAEIRKLEGTSRRIPIVALTAHALRGDRERCLAAGMDDYLTKPIDLDAMCAIVDKWTNPDVKPEDVKADAPEATAEIVTVVGTTPAGAMPPRSSGGEAATDLGSLDGKPVLDMQRLEASSMGNPELKEVLARAFLDHARPRVKRLREHLALGDSEAVEFDAHGMKGMCGTLGAVRCAEVFSRIEKCGREKRLPPVGPMLDRAEIEIGQVEEELGPSVQAA